VVLGKGGEHLAVEEDALLLQLVDERAVGLVAVLAECGVEAYDPELAVVSLLVAAMVKGVLARVLERLVREAFLLGACVAEALHPCEDVAAALC